MSHYISKLNENVRRIHVRNVRFKFPKLQSDGSH